ncbi:MAG: sodium/proline symporter PutP [Pseudomonadota bacterium]|jgi:sodium/proline symporter
MQLHQNIYALISFVTYLSIVMLVGLVACLATRNLSDYVLGGRKLGGAVAALSAGASDMSSWLLMGLPGVIYAKGLGQIWISVGLVLGAYGCWRLLARRLRIYSEVANDSVTIPAYLDNRFKDSSLAIRVFSALAILIFFTFYVAAGLYSSAILLERSFDLSYHQGLWLGAVIIMSYTSIGGFLAVSWTDFFQGTLMLICLILVPLFAFNALGDTTSIKAALIGRTPAFFDSLAGVSGKELIGCLSWGLGYFGMPHILVRFMAVKSVKEIPLARRVCMGWMTFSLIGAVCVGLVGALYFEGSTALANRETVFMALLEIVFSPWVVGAVFAAILSSSMCAVDSQMLAASSALTEDFYRALFRRSASQKELVWVGRFTVALIAGVAIYIASAPSQSIMDLVEFAWAGLGATFGSVVVGSLYWRSMTRNAALVAMVSGTLTVLIWRGLGMNAQWGYELLPATLISAVALVVTTLLGKKPDRATLEQFDAVNQLVQASRIKK